MESGDTNSGADLQAVACLAAIRLDPFADAGKAEAEESDR